MYFIFNNKLRFVYGQTEQAQFGACGRILVTVLEGFDLKTPAAGKHLHDALDCLLLHVHVIHFLINI